MATRNHFGALGGNNALANATNAVINKSTDANKKTTNWLAEQQKKKQDQVGTKNNLFTGNLPLFSKHEDKSDNRLDTGNLPLFSGNKQENTVQSSPVLESKWDAFRKERRRVLNEDNTRRKTEIASTKSNSTPTSNDPMRDIVRTITQPTVANAAEATPAPAKANISPMQMPREQSEGDIKVSHSLSTYEQPKEGNNPLGIAEQMIAPDERTDPEDPKTSKNWFVRNFGRKSQQDTDDELLMRNANGDVVSIAEALRNPVRKENTPSLDSKLPLWDKLSSNQQIETRDSSGNVTTIADSLKVNPLQNVQLAAHSALQPIVDTVNNIVDALIGIDPAVSAGLQAEVFKNRDKSNSIYDNLFRQTKQDWRWEDVRNEDPLFDPKNLAMMWNEASELSEADGTPIINNFTELFNEQLNDESIDDGTFSPGNLTSIYMTGSRFKQYLAAGVPCNIPDEELAKIADDDIVRKDEMMALYGFAPYLPDDASVVKFMVEKLAYAPNDAAAKLRNIREETTTSTVNIDGTEYDSEELYDSLIRHLSNIQQTDNPEHFLDITADHTGENLYVPKYTWVEENGVPLAYVGGLYDIYMRKDGSIVCTFIDGSEAYFSDYDDYMNRLANYEYNDPSREQTQWVEVDDPNYLQKYIEGRTAITGYVYGVDYIDPNTGSRIPYPVAIDYISDRYGENFDYNFGANGKPARMLPDATEWMTGQHGGWGENFLPATTDLIAGSAPFMMPSPVSVPVALSGALVAGSNVEPFAKGSDNTYMKHKGTIPDYLKADLKAAGFTDEDINEYEGLTLEERLSFMTGTAATTAIEHLSEFISDKTLSGAVGKKIKKLPAGAQGIANWINRMFGEATEEMIATVPEELTAYGPTLAYSDPLTDEEGNPLTDTAGHELRNPNTSFTDRFANSGDGVIDAGLMGALLGGVLGLPNTLYSSQRALANRAKLRKSDIPNVTYVPNPEGE